MNYSLGATETQFKIAGAGVHIAVSALSIFLGHHLLSVETDYPRHLNWTYRVYHSDFATMGMLDFLPTILHELGADLVSPFNISVVFSCMYSELFLLTTE